VRFLRYIRRWGKKVVFLLNKVDILADGGEVAEARPRPPRRPGRAQSACAGPWAGRSQEPAKIACLRNTARA